MQDIAYKNKPLQFGTVLQNVGWVVTRCLLESHQINWKSTGDFCLNNTPANLTCLLCVWKLSDWLWAEQERWRIAFFSRYSVVRLCAIVCNSVKAWGASADLRAFRNTAVTETHLIMSSIHRHDAVSFSEALSAKNQCAWLVLRHIQVTMFVQEVTPSLCRPFQNAYPQPR